MAYTSTRVSRAVSSGRVLCQEFGERTDRLQLVLPQPAQRFLPESLFVQESPKHLRQLRIPIVVLAVDLFTAFGQVMFQLPESAGSLIWFAICFVFRMTS
jgi:hypothetical protein